MTPEEICGNRPVRTVPAKAGARVLFCEEGQPALLLCQNSRNSFEVLLSREKVDDLLPILQGNRDLLLTGFWRRRSGFHADGSRHFIWTLVLFTAVSQTGSDLMAA